MIKLFRIFVPIGNKRTYRLQELGDLDIQAAFIDAIAHRLGLVYVEDQTDQSEVCFANSTEIRPDYRITFCKKDLVSYIQAQLPGPGADLDEDEVAFPENSADLWEIKTVP